MFLRTYYLLYHSVFLHIPIYFPVFFYCFVLPHVGVEKFTQLLSGLLTLDPPLAYHPLFLTEAELQSWAMLAFKHLPKPRPHQPPASGL